MTYTQEQTQALPPPLDSSPTSRPRPSVYSGERSDDARSACVERDRDLRPLLDFPNKNEGRAFLASLPSAFTSLVFFDPEYRGVLDHQDYGNEGARQRGRSALPQMSEACIREFLEGIARVLAPRGHLMLWVDKFHVAEGVSPWFAGLNLKIVDMITWDKGRIGMGYRTRRKCEYLLVIQKLPVRAKGVWTLHDIPDVWAEKLPFSKGAHAHRKPIDLQTRLIEAVTAPGGVVVDPAAGSFSVMASAHKAGRHFLGCDLAGSPP